MRPMFCNTVIAASLALMGVTALAQTTATGTSTTANETQSTETMNASPAQATTVADKLVARFSTFAGSEENAASLVNGLRTGSEITLNDTASAGSTGGSTTFTPPTRPMGYGNVRIALSLAEAQLKSEGYSQPTAEQLQTALMGETSGATSQTTSQSSGILQMRASGMGWGKIANTMGFKLGPVMSGRVPANGAETAAQSGSYSGATTATGSSASSSGITTATGRPAGKSGLYSSGNGHGKGNGVGGSGIVNANGVAAGGNGGKNIRAFTASGNANGHAAVAGSATSGSSSGAVSAHGGGRGVGNAYGRSK